MWGSTRRAAHCCYEHDDQIFEALIAGERDPKVLADLARGRLKIKRVALIEALNGRFDDHHADLARLLLDQIDACSDHIDRLTARIGELVAELPEPTPPTDRTPTSTSDVPVEHDPDARRLTTVERLDEVPGIAERAAQIVIAEVGLNMAQFPTPARYIDLGSDYYTRRLDPDRKTRDLVRQLRALGHTVTLAPTA